MTDEVATLSTIKWVCLRNSGFDVEPYGINVLFKRKGNQAGSEVTSAGVPWYTTIESRITHKSDLNVHAADKKAGQLSAKH